MPKHKGLEVFRFISQKEFGAWLRKHQKQEESIWLKFAKKGTRGTSLSYEEAREEAIRNGWIDGLINKLDENYYLIKFSKRRPKSKWSKINRAIAEELIQTKRILKAGKEAVDAAKADGRWDAAYDSPKNMTIPNWFIDRVKKDKKAYKFLTTLKKQQRYTIAYNLRDAKKEETKQRRADKYLKMLQEEKKPS